MEALEDVFDSALLSGTSDARVWCHHSVAEYLCAQALAALPMSTAWSLLAAPGDPSTLRPQLEETAAWTAVLQDDMFDRLLKEELTLAALRVLDVREYHCEKTLAELHDPDLMPNDLRAAHAEVDALVDSIYSKRGYETDEQRLSDLFAMYEAMTAEEAAKATAKKPRGARK